MGFTVRLDDGFEVSCGTTEDVRRLYEMWKGAQKREDERPAGSVAFEYWPLINSKVVPFLEVLLEDPGVGRPADQLVTALEMKSGREFGPILRSIRAFIKATGMGYGTVVTRQSIAGKVYYSSGPSAKEALKLLKQYLVELAKT